MENEINSITKGIYNDDILRRLTDDNVDEIMSTIKEFISNTASQIQSLKTAVFYENRLEVSFFAHLIKVASEKIGAVALYLKSSLLENAANKKDFDFLKSVVKELERSLDMFDKIVKKSF
ncbi:MAG: hypothetical protein HN826_02985 [Methylococcales bacterium]|jgi:hypothetical protein|nr:hypothetical protein [Methylococcales bacterium]